MIHYYLNWSHWSCWWQSLRSCYSRCDEMQLDHFSLDEVGKKRRYHH